MWQSDITSYVMRRQGRRVYLTVFLDDHSRFIVAWALATHQRTPLVTEPLLEGIARFGKPKEVLTDQGRQYYAWRGKSGFQKLLAREGIQHVVSRAHHPQTLGKCERLWKTVAVEFWDRVGPEDLDDARRRFTHWVAHYNHFRPHQGIDGLVPADRFFGAEDVLRAALERELEGNELRVALGEAPRRPVYLVGQIGDERIALHGERGRLLIDTPNGGQRELALNDLGIEGARDDERRDDEPRGRDQSTNTGFKAEAQTDGPQENEVREPEEHTMASTRTVGGCAPGAEGDGAPDVHADPRVLDGEEDEGVGGEGAGRELAARLAAEPAGDLGDDGGAVEAAAAPRGPGSVRARSGREPGVAAEADHGAREGAGSHGRPRARAANGPVGDGPHGVGRKGGPETCEIEVKEGPSPRQEGCRAESACGSAERRGKRGSRARRWMRWPWARE